MTTVSTLRTTLLAASITLASTFAMAQNAPAAGALSSTTLKAHRDDLEAMLSDLSKVQSADTAARYDTYLAGQLPKYLANHKSLHSVALPGFGNLKKLGKATAEQQRVADAVEQLNETHFPKLVAEMARVEKLNPVLKKNFDQLRSLE